MCHEYALQLEDAGEITKASTYLVAIKKFKEAAIMLLKNNLFREALSVVKSQEKPDNEIILEITKKWGEYNVLHGHPKEAAHWLEYYQYIPKVFNVMIINNVYNYYYY